MATRLLGLFPDRPAAITPTHCHKSRKQGHRLGHKYLMLWERHTHSHECRRTVTYTAKADTESVMTDYECMNE